MPTEAPWLAILRPRPGGEWTPAPSTYLVPAVHVVELRRLLNLCESSSAVQHNRRAGFKECGRIHIIKDAGDDLGDGDPLVYPATDVVMSYLQLADASVRGGVR